MSSTPTPVTTTSAARRSRARRILQACHNCRRKKTRCPGERPQCSTCIRLGQTCRFPGYPAGEGPAHNIGDAGLADQTVYIRRLEGRLARLEARLEEKQDRLDSSGLPRQEETPQSSLVQDAPSSPAITVADSVADTVPASPPPRSSTHESTTFSPHSREHAHSLPSTRIIEEAIRVYFRSCHRQPMWLFEPPSSLTTSSADAILLCILALSVQHSPDAFEAFTEQPLPTPTEYNNAARRLILDHVAKPCVDLATLQALGLLSFSNLVCGDLQLAAFHIGLAGSLMQCAGLDTHLSSDRTPLLESQRRLFWSVQTVAVLCGLPTKIPSTYDIQAPSLLVPAHTVWRSTTRRPDGGTDGGEAAPLLPLDPGRRGERGSIWLHMVRSASLWGLVRAYVGKCCQGRGGRGKGRDQERRAPWQPDSDYTAINAQLLDMEGAFPVSFRYDASRFLERTTADLRRHAAFWLPWMKIQVTYHTLHAVLNHPFLYSPRVAQPRPPPGPNAFWKTSTDLALLHSTWIARLLGVASHKGLVLEDPFFGYAAAVAITLHLYWSRAADPAIRAAADKYIQVCRTFVGELAQKWPVCRSIEADLDKLMQLSSSSRQQPEGSSTGTVPASTMADNVALLWRILDFAAMHQPNAPMGQSLFDASLTDTLKAPPGSPEPMHLQDPEVASPPDDFQTSLGDYAAPPDWFAPPGNDAREMETVVTSQVDIPALDLSWTTWDASTNTADTTAMLYDPFAQLFTSRSGPDYSRWWDGNL